jgi:hypothetical protein
MVIDREGKMLKDSYSDDQDIVSNNTPQEPPGFTIQMFQQLPEWIRVIVNDELKEYLSTYQMGKGIDFIEAAHENAQRHRQLSLSR